MKYIVITLLVLSNNASFAQNHEHHHASDKTSKIIIKSHKKFIATDDLKMRMSKISNLMKELNEKKSDSKVVAEYGVLIANTVNDIF